MRAQGGAKGGGDGASRGRRRMGVFKGNGQRWVVQLLTDVITSQVEWRNRKEEEAEGLLKEEGSWGRKFMKKGRTEERADAGCM